MSLNNRQFEIMSLLKMYKSLSIKELSQQLYFSESTVRRDLEVLENKKLIRHTHGRASLIMDQNAEIPLAMRETANRAAKETIGKMAASFIQDGDSLFLDSSTTVLNILPHIMDKKDLTVITNGLKTATQLSHFRCVKTICTGGHLRENSLSFIGDHAKNVLSFYNADKLFFSTRAVSTQHGVTDISEDEVSLRRIMLSHANQSFLLVDSSKINQVSMCNICSVTDVSFMITDAPVMDAEKWSDLGVNIIPAY